MSYFLPCHFHFIRGDSKKTGQPRKAILKSQYHAKKPTTHNQAVGYSLLIFHHILHFIFPFAFKFTQLGSKVDGYPKDSTSIAQSLSYVYKYPRSNIGSKEESQKCNYNSTYYHCNSSTVLNPILCILFHKCSIWFLCLLSGREM